MLVKVLLSIFYTSILSLGSSVSQSLLLELLNLDYILQQATSRSYIKALIYYLYVFGRMIVFITLSYIRMCRLLIKTTLQGNTRTCNLKKQGSYALDTNLSQYIRSRSNLHKLIFIIYLKSELEHKPKAFWSSGIAVTLPSST